MAPTTQVIRDGLAFNITEDGPEDGEPVLLLHGFPQHSNSWDAMVPLLTVAGYRTIRMDQRGYSPGARPLGRYAYRISELVADAAEVIDQRAGGRAHVIGHDWGAGVAWPLAAAHPERVASLTALSVPHPRAFLHAMATSSQGFRSWYMYFFQLPFLPETLLYRALAAGLVRSGQSAERAERDAAGFVGPKALTGPINWYRAMPFIDPRRSGDRVTTPTLLIWSDRDRFVHEKGVRMCEQWVSGPYRVETLSGVSHWIPDEAPARATELIIPRLRAYPVRPAQSGG